MEGFGGEAPQKNNHDRMDAMKRPGWDFDNPQDNSLFLTSGAAVYWGAVRDNSVHSHYALQWTISLGDPYVLETEESTSGTQASLLESNRRHRLTGGQNKLFILLAEPLSPIARNLRSQNPLKGPMPRDPKAFSLILTKARQGEIPVRRMIDQTLSSCGVASPAPPLKDQRILRTMEIIEKTPGKKITVPALADNVALSVSRLQHLFKEQAGIPIKQYLLWKKLLDGVKLASRGRSLTDAAYDAGFSDSSHMSRTFTKMFGFNLSAILKNSRSVQVICD